MSCSGPILFDIEQFDCLQDDLRQACKRHLVHFRFRKGCTVCLNISSLSTACSYAEVTCHFTV